MNSPKFNLKALTESELVGNLTKHLDTYEKRVKELVNEFDVKSRDARHKGQQKLDKLADGLKRTRTDLEKRVSTLLQQEGHRLNQGVNDLFNYLKSVTKGEKLEKKSAAPAKKKASKGDSSPAKKTVTRKPRARKETVIAATEPASSPVGA